MAKPTTETSRASHIPVLALCVLTVLGGWLRFGGLGDRDFWFDESCTFIYVHQLFDWPADSSLLVESTNLPYYILLRGWIALMGDSEAGYRSLSALAATLTIPLLGILAARLGGAIAGLVCAAVVAFHPLHIHYAHEARAYALWMLLLSAATLLLVKASRSGRWRWWAAYGTTILACLHLHYYTIYCVPATIGSIWLSDHRRRALGRWLVSTAAVCACFLPYLLAAVIPAARAGGSSWISSSWAPLRAIVGTIGAFLPAGPFPPHLRGLSILSPDTVSLAPGWLVGLTQAVPVVAALVAVVLLQRNPFLHGVSRNAESASITGSPRGPHGVGAPVPAARYTKSDSAWGRAFHHRTLGQARSETLAPFVFVGVLALGSLSLAWLYSLLIRPNYLPGRYDLVAWPACMVFVGLIVAALARSAAPKSRTWVVWSMCLAWIGCSVLPIARMRSLKPPPSFHRVRGERLAELTGPEDLVLTLSYDRDYLLYYLYRAGFVGRIASYPSWLDQQIGWLDTPADIASTRLDRDAVERLELLRNVKRGGRRVFLLADSLDPTGTGQRAGINERFFSALRQDGYVTQVVDERLLIWELHAGGGSAPR